MRTVIIYLIIKLDIISIVIIIFTTINYCHQYLIIITIKKINFLYELIVLKNTISLCK